MIERGHGDEVERQARNGDWNCAQAFARELIEQDRLDAAMELLTPFVDSGWWPAASVAAGYLDEGGRMHDAIALVRPHAEAGKRPAVHRMGSLLAECGRGEAAFELLLPHAQDWYLAKLLVKVSVGLGRDDEVTALLLPQVEAWLELGEWRFHQSLGLVAAVYERQGRLDEALDLLLTKSASSVNYREQLADLLAEHGRLEELREYIAGEGGSYAAWSLVKLLESRGDIEGAIAVLRPLAADDPHHAAIYLAELLERHGRTDEAIAVLVPIIGSLAEPGSVQTFLCLSSRCRCVL
ncbi:tetratricopeptide repeat protein, partial [Glycomyces buryatensis]